MLELWKVLEDFSPSQCFFTFNVEKIREFLDEVPVDFPIVYGDMFDVMDISTEYGNSFGGLPFSAFIDRDGNVRYTQKPGEVTFEEAEEILKRLL